MLSSQTIHIPLPTVLLLSLLGMGCAGDEAVECREGYALDSQGRCQVVDSDGEIVEIRLDGHGSMDRIREMIEETRHRVEERRGVIETRIVSPGWTTDASYTIVSPHGAIIHAN